MLHKLLNATKISLSTCAISEMSQKLLNHYWLSVAVTIQYIDFKLAPTYSTPQTQFIVSYRFLRAPRYQSCDMDTTELIKLSTNYIRLTQIHAPGRCCIPGIILQRCHLRIITINALWSQYSLTWCWLGSRSDSRFVFSASADALIARLTQATAMAFGGFQSFPFWLFGIKLLSYFGADVR